MSGQGFLRIMLLVMSVLRLGLRVVGAGKGHCRRLWMKRERAGKAKEELEKRVDGGAFDVVVCVAGAVSVTCSCSLALGATLHNNRSATSCEARHTKPSLECANQHLIWMKASILSFYSSVNAGNFCPVEQ